MANCVSGSIRLQGSFFLYAVSHQSKEAFEATAFGGHVCVSSNQIAVIFDHQYRWKEQIESLVSLYEFIHQRKLAPETNPFGLVGPVLVLTDCRILSSTISLERIN